MPYLVVRILQPTAALLAASTGVLTTGRPVVVGTIAGAEVVMIATLVERVMRSIGTHATLITITQQGLVLGRTATERHGDRVAVRVTSAHRLTPITTHDLLLGVVQEHFSQHTVFIR